MTASDDAALMSRLAAIAAQVDPPPADAFRSGRAVFALRALDSELAELVADSHVDAHLARTAAGGTRLLAFESVELAIELQCGPGGLLGQLLPPTPARVVLQTAAGVAVTATADGEGRFSFADPPDALVRFLVGRVATTWVRLGT